MTNDWKKGVRVSGRPLNTGNSAILGFLRMIGERDEGMTLIGYSEADRKIVGTFEHKEGSEFTVTIDISYPELSKS